MVEHILVEKLNAKETLGRPRCTCEEWSLRKHFVRMWTGLNWLWRGHNGLLWRW